MYKKILQVLNIIFIYAFIGISIATVYKFNNQFPIYIGLILVVGGFLAFNEFNKYLGSNDIKLFNRINVSIVGKIVFLCSGIYVFYLW